MTFAATLIDDTNKEAFMTPLIEDSVSDCDIFIGLYEEETDTACGVLSAAAMPDRKDKSDSFALLVREIIIADRYRSKESESALLRYLQEIAALYECSSVFVPEYISEKDLEERDSFFTDLGFYRDDKTIALYKIRICDIKDPITDSEYGCLNITDLSEKQWKQFKAEAACYSFEIMDRDYYHAKTSIFLVDDDGNLIAGLLTSMNDDELHVEGIAPFGGAEESLVQNLVFWEKDALKKHYKNGDHVFLYMITDKFYNRILKDMTDDKADRIGSLVGFNYEVPVSVS